jgi:hypothetical protein
MREKLPAFFKVSLLFLLLSALTFSVNGETKTLSWLVMLYQDADDEMLEEDICLDLNEAERAGSTDRVAIVSQLDRFKGGYDGDGDWTGTKRFYVTRDEDVSKIRSKELADLGEKNMADPATLVDFVAWAVAKYPAKKYALILEDHGAGWPGGWTDADPNPKDILSIDKLDKALGRIREKTGIDRFELIGLDACLMGSIEVFSVLKAHARYAVASQEIEPGIGWAYAAFLSSLGKMPESAGDELAKMIVGSYIDKDIAVTDDAVRSRFAEGTTKGGLARLIGSEATIAAIDLGKLDGVTKSLDSFVIELVSENQKTIAEARGFTQSYSSVFGDEYPSPYLDICHFALIISGVSEKTGNKPLAAKAATLVSSIGNAVIAERHGPKRPGSNGISIYFPTSDLYKDRDGGVWSYTESSERFSKESLWDDFLLSYYTGKKIAKGKSLIAKPSKDERMLTPGKGSIEIAPVELGTTTIRPDETTLLRTTVTGTNIGYIYLFVGLKDEQTRSTLIADMDFIVADDTRQIGGIYYPDWGDEGKVTIELPWQPFLFALDDGFDSIHCLLLPRIYGATKDDMTYTVEGLYTPAKNGARRYALLSFGADGRLIKAVGYTGKYGTGSPHELKPGKGDTFTIYSTWIDEKGGGKTDQSIVPGGTLTFGDQGITWVEKQAPAGDYIIGIIVCDLDGNKKQANAKISVRD